jgi:hypothetical protein
VKPQAALLIVLGLLLGPGYLAFCRYVSGGPSQTFEFAERRDRWELPDGTILRFRSGMGFKPLALEMHPDSNLYRFKLKLDVDPGVSAKGVNEYQLTLLQGDTSIFNRSVRIESAGNANGSFDPVEIHYPGSYSILLEEVGKPALTVSKVILEVETGAEKPQMWLAWSGLVMILVGIAFQVREYLGFGRAAR